MKKYVFFVSDGTGITAETLGHSLLTQFEGFEFVTKTIPYVNNVEKAIALVSQINQNFELTKNEPIIFASLINSEIRSCIKQCRGFVFDLFETFLNPMEQALQAKSSFTMGKSHSMHNAKNYQLRIEAVNYTLAHDDGAKVHNYGNSDLVLVGVSRSGKTPTCLYLALQFGLKVANYPFTDDELANARLPENLRPVKSKLFGLTIDPERLHQIRTERRRSSKYASTEQCRLEISEFETMLGREGIPYINATSYSIEEISTKIIALCGIERKLF